MQMLRTLNRRISSPRFDAGTVQLLSYGLSLFVMLLGIRKVTAMQLDEPQLVFGILLVLILCLQMILMGTLIGLHGRKP